MPSPDERRTVVSITPLNVRADSRTFKQAASMARLGFRSVVVEGLPSGFDGGELPFELVTIPNAAPLPSASKGSGGGPAGETPTAGEAQVSTAAEPLPLPVRLQVAARGGLSFGWMLMSASAREKAKQPLRRFLATPPLRFLRRALGAVYFRTENLYWTAYFYRGWRRDYDRRFREMPLRVMPPASAYYLHAFYQYPAVRALSRANGVPYVYDAHDFYSSMEAQEPGQAWWMRLTHWYERRLERECVRNAAAVVTVSDGLADLMEQRFGRRPVVVLNTPDPRLHEQTADSIRQRARVPRDAFVIAVVNNLKQAMAVEELLQALLLLPRDVMVVFLGARYDDVRRRASELGLQDRTVFLDPVRPTEVVPFIRDADALINLYYSASVNYVNCLPNNFFSAIAAGLPLLYPELDEMRRVAAKYEIGVPIDPRDPASIARGISALRDDPARRERIRSALAGAAAHFTWEREEAVLRDVLRDVLATAAA